MITSVFSVIKSFLSIGVLGAAPLKVRQWKLSDVELVAQVPCSLRYRTVLLPASAGRTPTVHTRPFEKCPIGTFQVGKVSRWHFGTASFLGMRIKVSIWHFDLSVTATQIKFPIWELASSGQNVHLSRIEPKWLSTSLKYGDLSQNPAFLAQPNISRSARTFLRFSSFCSSVSSVLAVWCTG